MPPRSITHHSRRRRTCKPDRPRTACPVVCWLRSTVRGNRREQQQRPCEAVEGAGAGAGEPIQPYCTHLVAQPPWCEVAQPVCDCHRSHLGFGVDAHIAAQLARFAVGRAALIIADASLAAHFARGVVGLAACIAASAGSCTALSLAIRTACSYEGRHRAVWIGSEGALKHAAPLTTGCCVGGGTKRENTPFTQICLEVSGLPVVRRWHHIPAAATPQICSGCWPP